jgi:hypothetical protein
MIIADSPGFIYFVQDMRCSSIFLSFNTLLSVDLITKLLRSNQIGVGNTRLTSFFSNIGITHQFSCPHTHQQNGDAECKHHHIVEMGLTLLAHASMPLKYWDEAFLAMTYLINHIPLKSYPMIHPCTNL